MQWDKLISRFQEIVTIKEALKEKFHPEEKYPKEEEAKALNAI